MIRVLVRDIPNIDAKLGFVSGTPGNGQIAFGLFVSVALAAFLVKRFLQAHFIPVIIGVMALYIGLFTKFIGSDTLTPLLITNMAHRFLPASHLRHNPDAICFIFYTRSSPDTGPPSTSCSRRWTKNSPITFYFIRLNGEI